MPISKRDAASTTYVCSHRPINLPAQPCHVTIRRRSGRDYAMSHVLMYRCFLAVL